MGWVKPSWKEGKKGRPRKIQEDGSVAVGHRHLDDVILAARGADDQTLDLGADGEVLARTVLGL